MYCRTFEVSPEAPRSIRAFVLTSLARLGCSTDAYDRAMQCASEVVTDAYCHGFGQLTVSVWGAGLIHVEIDEAWPTLGSHHGSSLDVGCEWRFEIVEAFSEEWGVLPGDEGRTIWFDVAC